MNKKQIVQMIFVVIAIVLTFSGGYNFHKDIVEMDIECEDCNSQECMDNDSICGDFGTYYWKMVWHIGILPALGLCLLLSIVFDEEAKK